MNIPQVRIPHGNKYVLLTMPLNHVGDLTPADLGDGYLTSTDLPVAVPEHWQRWVGTLQYGAIEEAGYYLIAHAPATYLERTDGDNRRLRTRVNHLYTGFTLAVPYIGHEQLICLTGASREDETDVRQFTTYSATYFVPGSTPSDVTVARLRSAKRIGVNIASLSESRSVENLSRLLTAFRTAHQARELDVRLHQFVRVVEGFVLPRSNKKAIEFADRVSQLISGMSVSDLRQLYTMRSTIEHLRGPTVGLVGTPRKRNAILRLRSIQAETIARHFLATFLENPQLWPYFTDAAATRAFWKLSQREKEELWVTKPCLAYVSRRFASAEHFEWQDDSVSQDAF